MTKELTMDLVEAMHWCTHKQAEDILQIAVENVPASHVQEIKRILAAVNTGKDYAELTDAEVEKYTRNFDVNMQEVQ